ncbi:MAG TPA: BTAD domain-containing putative transcriptional regulator [Acidimicrobiales bacterium]|nr:BTAD domain-containing putative transcriptional regulator [Acidimicrobiales bacterium]
MRSLPTHHVGRRRLTDRCGTERVVVVEAAGGFGKTVFASELVDAWGLIGINVTLHEGGMSGSVFAARLRAAVAAAGFTRAADDSASAPDDPTGAIDLMVEALADEPCAFVIDDVHHAERDAGLLIDRLASGLRGDQRLVVLGRRLPPGAERLRRADALQLTASDLALSGDETLRLCRDGFGLDVAEDVARGIDGATGGWTAATVLAAARAKRTGESVLELAERTTHAAHQGAVAAILDEAIAALSAEGRGGLAQLARLPLLNADVVDAAVASGFFERSLAVGVPMFATDSGWWDLAGPVRDYLATLASSDAPSMRRAAERYCELGRLTEALDLLFAAGDGEAAARLLSSGDLGAVDSMDVREYRAAVERLGDDAVRANPMVLVILARFFDTAAMFEGRERAIERAEQINAETGDSALGRAIEAERANDLVRLGRFDEAEAWARALLEQLGPSELLTRARVLSCLGRAVCWHYDADGRRDLASLREADELLAEASSAYVRLGMRAAAAGLAPYRAMWIQYARGDVEGAIERLDEALGQITDRPRRWAYLLTMRAEAALELGRHDEMQRNIDDVLRVAAQLEDEQLRAYAHWNAMSASSRAGDAAGAIEHLRVVESNKGTWWPIAGADFCAWAADDLGRVGEVALAYERLEWARELSVDADALIAIAEGSLLARHGDPEEAERVLLLVPSSGIDPREYWRIDLLRAYAAFRRGDRGAGALAARAFEEAAAMRLGHLPLTKERQLTEQLIALAVETGQPAACALEVAVLPITLRVLGRFELARGGRAVKIAPGLGAQLVKLVAVSDGRIPAERAIEALWPEVDPDAGRNRLRTVLNRLRAEAGEVVVREGEALALDASIAVDLAQFDQEARRALALGRSEPTHAVALARSAISRYRGDLLPDDPYEDWAEIPRQHARRVALELLELCCDVAMSRGDLDETSWAVERAIDLVPDDDRWYLRAAETLAARGSRGAAVSVLRRARRELSRQGLDEPERLVSLERALSGAAS